MRYYTITAQQVVTFLFLKLSSITAAFPFFTLYNVECSSKCLINGKMLLRGKIDLSTLGPPNGGMKIVPFLPWAVWQLLPSGEYYFPENTIIGNFDKKYTHTLVSIVAGVQKYVILMNISV